MADWDGERYADVSALQRMVATESMRGITLDGDERLLDVGCGDGFLTMLLHERLPRGTVVGVDASRRMIDKARTRVAPGDLRIRFHVDDALALPFDGDFDIAVSFNALHWVHDQATALRGIARALVDDGRAVIQLVCATGNRSIEDIATEVTTAPPWAVHFHDFPPPYLHVTPDQFRDTAVAAGFTVTALDTRDLHWRFDSTRAFEDWFAAGASDWTSRLPPADTAPFVTEVIARYQRLIGEPALLRFAQLRAALTPTR